MLVSKFFVLFKLDPFIILFSFFGSIIQLYRANLELIVAAIFGCETTHFRLRKKKRRLFKIVSTIL